MTVDTPVSLSPIPGITLQNNDAANAASQHLQHRLATRWEDALAAFHDQDFYIEAVIIGVTLLIALLIAHRVARGIRNKLNRCQPKVVDLDILLKPLPLIQPSAIVLGLWFAQFAAASTNVGGDFLAGATELAYAFWLSRLAFMAIKARGVATIVAASIAVHAILRVLNVTQSMSTYLDSLAVDIGSHHITALRLLNGIVIFIVVFWGAGALSKTFESYLRRSTALTPSSRELTAKIFRISTYLAAGLITLSAVGIDLTAFAIFSGAVGVGVGLGLQKLAANFFSGFTLLIERAIRIGDLIEVGNNTGWVRALNVRYALLETADGREVLIPNEELVSSRVTNWTLSNPQVRIEIKTTAVYGSDAEKIRELMLAAAREHKKCLAEPQPTCFLREFTERGLLFQLTFWIADIREGSLGIQSEVMLAVLGKFRAEGIVFAQTN